jgi:membrane fusion protein (multidrug efflux system)
MNNILMKHRSIILLLILSILVITESCTGNDNKPETQATSNETKNEIEMLEVTKAVLMQPQIEVKLPGDLNPWFETRIYANVKGFVKDVYVDRGSLVKKGQLLALLDAPELYSDLNKGKAKVNELKARFRASKSYYVRISETSKTQGAVSAYESMMHIIDYLKITAPFDGIISTRGISAGALVGPLQSGSENVPPLFLIEQIDKMRLTVAIPEVYANELLSGSIAQFYVSSTPEKKYAATLARTSDKMENNVRSMLAEFDVMNKSHELKGGMFAEAYIQMKRSVPTFFVPKSAVLKSTLGVFLVNVNADKKIEWIPVHVGNTYGNMLEVFGEISEGDVYALHAGEQIKEGSVVKKIVEMKTQ